MDYKHKHKHKFWKDKLEGLFKDYDSEIGTLFNGMIALSLSLLLWKMTGSFLGWLVLFLPGSALILKAWVSMIYRSGSRDGS